MLDIQPQTPSSSMEHSQTFQLHFPVYTNINQDDICFAHALQLYTNFNAKRKKKEPFLNIHSLKKLYNVLMAEQAKIIEQIKKLPDDEDFLFLRTKKWNLKTDRASLPFNLMINRQGDIIILPPIATHPIENQGKNKIIRKGIRFHDAAMLAISKGKPKLEKRITSSDIQTLLEDLKKETELQTSLARYPQFVRVHDCGKHLSKKIKGNWQWRTVQDYIDGPLITLCPQSEAEYTHQLGIDGSIITIEGESKFDRLSDKENQLIIFDLLEGLHFLRVSKILHGDIKPANLMYTCDGNRITGAKIIDFGGAIQLENENDSAHELSTFTPLYCAPEYILNYNNHRHSASFSYDTWSMGLAIAELQGLFVYFTDCTEETFFPKLRNFINNYSPNKIPFDLKQTSWIYYLIWRMLDPDPHRRITSQQAKDLMRMAIEEKDYLTLFKLRYPHLEPESLPVFFSRTSNEKCDWLKLLLKS